MPEGFSTRHSDGDIRFLILCDHASNYVPSELDNLGLPPEHLTRHIAYDPGAVEVARFIADSLNDIMMSPCFVFAVSVTTGVSPRSGVTTSGHVTKCRPLIGQSALLLR